MSISNDQAAYYKSRLDELSEQLVQTSRRHRRALGDVRRANVTTQLIRKLHRLDYMKLNADEIAASFLDVACKSLSASRAAVFRRRVGGRGYEAVKIRGFIAPRTPLVVALKSCERFIGPDSDGVEMRFAQQLRALAGGSNFAWAANPVAGLAVLFANGMENEADGWRFSAQDEQMLEAVLDVVGSVIERSRTERQLRHNAFHDGLTGLPNRGMLFRHLEDCTRRTHRDSNDIAALLFIDLDRFKLVNDSLGHQAGDKLLVAFAQRMRALVRPGDLLARLSGDEFAVLAEGLHTIDDARMLAQRMLDNLRAPFRIHGHTVYTGASIGIAESRPDHASAADFLRDADIAMYHAKDQGGSRYEVYGNEMHGKALSQLRLETELREAVEREELTLYYQPIFCLRTGAIEALEALLRWHHPRDGLLEPDSFVSVLKQTGMLANVGDWALRRVARDINLWRNELTDIGSVKVCVNVSEGQFVQADFVDTLSGVMTEYGIAADQLRLELTEGTLLDCKSIETSVLERLRDMGIKIMLDDFGTGYSSLSRLQQLPIDTIKIDKSFVERLGEEGSDATIVRAIIAMGRSLGVRLVAEGAERPAQLQALRALGCDFVQGYLMGRPMAASKVGQFVENQVLAVGAAPVGEP